MQASFRDETANAQSGEGGLELSPGHNKMRCLHLGEISPVARPPRSP